MHFMDRKHFNWVGSKAKGEGLNKEYEVYSVLYYPIKTNPVTFMALRTSKRGTEQFYLNVEDSCVVLFDRIYHALRNKEPDTEFQYIPETRKFSNDLVELERKHPQKITEMKIGVIYCKPGQTKPQEMFQNGRDSLCPSFWTWINTMGKEINLEQWNMYKGDMGSTGKTYYKNWEFEYNNKKQNIEIIYHLAPLLEPEGHRRLIGNDVAVIFFMEEGPRSDLDVSDREEPTNAKEEEEEGESFKSNSHFKLDPMVVSLLGTVPQVFIAIQPYRGKYRVQFFSYTNIKPHLPPPPTHPISTTQMVDLVLTKIYNGLMSSRFCVPMNRLFFVPRGQTLQEDILEKYLSNNLTTKKKKKEETRVLIIDEPKKKKMECVRVTVVSVCIETMDQSYDLTVILTLGENQQKTKTIKHSNKPIWNEDYTFDLCGIDKEFTEFEVDVYCHRNCGTIGLVRIPVFDLLYLGGQLEDQPQWFTLMRRSLDDSTTEGSILLKFALTDEEVVLTEPKTPRSFRKSSILPSIKPKVPNL
uniref:Uncharacterized protein n=1 Tax=Arcella intermedia TaxID=1963864 RepID=A0A6B2L1H6_9EUKA